MALLTAQPMNVTGAAVTYSTPTVSDTVPPSDRAFLHVKAGATPTNVTIVVPGTRFGQANPDIGPVAVAANTDRMFGPLVGDLADPATGLVTINYSSTSTITAAVVSM